MSHSGTHRIYLLSIRRNRYTYANFNSFRNSMHKSLLSLQQSASAILVLSPKCISFYVMYVRVQTNYDALLSPARDNSIISPFIPSYYDTKDLILLNEYYFNVYIVEEMNRQFRTPNVRIQQWKRDYKEKMYLRCKKIVLSYENAILLITIITSTTMFNHRKMNKIVVTATRWWIAAVNGTPVTRFSCPYLSKKLTQ